MFNSISGMNIHITGGSAEDNSQLCTVVAAALRSSGFGNVRLEATNEYPLAHVQHDSERVNAIRGLNPDLFDTTVSVTGESEEEIRGSMPAMAFETVMERDPYGRLNYLYVNASEAH